MVRSTIICTRLCGILFFLVIFFLVANFLSMFLIAFFCKVCLVLIPDANAREREIPKEHVREKGKAVRGRRTRRPRLGSADASALGPARPVGSRSAAVGLPWAKNPEPRG